MNWTQIINYSQPGCPGMLNCAAYLSTDEKYANHLSVNGYSTIISIIKYNYFAKIGEARNLTGIVDQKGIKQTTVLLGVIILILLCHK